MLRALREHSGLTAVLVLASILRLAAALAHPPALLFNDSWTYVDLALRADPVGFAPERPSGYPLILRPLLLSGGGLTLVTTAQHLAGLATGGLAYALLLRLGVGRGLATAATALVLLDSYAVTLEQHVLTESFFGLALLGSAFAVIAVRNPLGWAASGILLGIAATMRTAGLFAVAVWLGYLLWNRGTGLKAVAAALISLTVVLCGYAALHARGDPTRRANPNEFALTEMDGWFLYAKAAAIADCRGADIPPRTRPLCQDRARRSRDAEFYLFNRESPAKKLVSRLRGGTRQIDRNRLLRSFALAIIRERPAAYARLVWSDVLGTFTPGGRGVDVTVRLPRPGAALPGGGRVPLPCRECDGVNREPVRASVRDEHLPHYEPRVRWPAPALVIYQDWLHTPRWLMGLLGLVVAATAALCLTPLRRELPRRRETFLLGGTALAVIVGSAATANPLVRFLVPLVPLLACGGLLGLCDLISAMRDRRAAPGRERMPAVRPARMRS